MGEAKILEKWVGTINLDNSWEMLFWLQELYPHFVGKVL